MRVSDDHDFDALEKGGFVMSEEPHILNANAEEELLFLFDRQRSREKGLAGQVPEAPEERGFSIVIDPQHLCSERGFGLSTRPQGSELTSSNVIAK